MSAVTLLHSQLCKALLEVGANMNLYNKAGITSFSSACMHGDLNTVTFMLSLGADVNGGSQQPLFLACKGTVGKQFYRWVCAVALRMLWFGVRRPCLNQALRQQGWHSVYAKIRMPAAHVAPPQRRVLGPRPHMLHPAHCVVSYQHILRMQCLSHRHDESTTEQQTAWRAAWAADKDTRAIYV